MYKIGRNVSPAWKKMGTASRLPHCSPGENFQKTDCSYNYIRDCHYCASVYEKKSMTSHVRRFRLVRRIRQWEVWETFARRWCLPPHGSVCQ